MSFIVHRWGNLQSRTGPVAERAQRLLALLRSRWVSLVCLIDSGWFHLYDSVIFIARIYPLFLCVVYVCALGLVGPGFMTRSEH
jgi:hypothetical protein